MTYTQAKMYLRRAERSGYVAYHKGIVSMERKPWWGSPARYNYGINIDGDGCEGRLFGCPEIIWEAESAEEQFPPRRRGE